MDEITVPNVGVKLSERDQLPVLQLVLHTAYILTYLQIHAAKITPHKGIK